MVRTRFAPSPTGYLHIGGVRTALFNWLFARQHGGQFLLRIDDTDAGRNVEAALAPILHGFRWLGLEWDEGPEVGGRCGPYFQSQRLARYQAAARLLVERGYAYWDFARPEELQAERDAAMAEKRTYVYSRRWMAETAADRARWEQDGRQGECSMPGHDVLRVKGQLGVAMPSSCCQRVRSTPLHPWELRSMGIPRKVPVICTLLVSGPEQTASSGGR